MNTPRSNLDDRLQIGRDNLRRHFAVRRAREAREIGVGGFALTLLVILSASFCAMNLCNLPAASAALATTQILRARRTRGPADCNASWRDKAIVRLIGCEKGQKWGSGVNFPHV